MSYNNLLAGDWVVCPMMTPRLGPVVGQIRAFKPGDFGSKVMAWIEPVNMRSKAKLCFDPAELTRTTRPDPGEYERSLEDE